MGQKVEANCKKNQCRYMYVDVLKIMSHIHVHMKRMGPKNVLFPRLTDVSSNQTLTLKIYPSNFVWTKFQCLMKVVSKSCRINHTTTQSSLLGPVGFSQSGQRGSRASCGSCSHLPGSLVCTSRGSRRPYRCTLSCSGIRCYPPSTRRYLQ